MKKHLFTLSLLSLLLMAAMLLMVSCGGGGSSSTAPTVFNCDLTGNWAVASPAFQLLVLHLAQVGQTVTGTADRAITAGANDTGNVTTGSNVSGTFSITIVFEDTQNLVLNGTCSSANDLSGTTSSFYPGNPADTDNFTATRQ